MKENWTEKKITIPKLLCGLRAASVTRWGAQRGIRNSHQLTGLEPPRAFEACILVAQNVSSEPKGRHPKKQTSPRTHFIAQATTGPLW